jgi:hypothetical protein
MMPNVLLVITVALLFECKGTHGEKASARWIQKNRLGIPQDDTLNGLTGTIIDNADTIKDTADGLESTAETIGSTVNDVLQQTEQLWRQYSGKVGLGFMAGFGVIFLLFGFRILKVTLFVAGFAFGSTVVFMLMRQHTELEYKYILASGAAGGIIGGALTLFVLKIGIFVLGGFLGFWIGTLALSIPIPIDHQRRTLMQLLEEPWQYYAVIGGSCLLFGLLALTNKFQKFLIILTTSLGGAICLCAFADHWLNSGFSLAGETLLSTARERKDITQVQIKASALAVLIVCVAIAIIGIYFQYWSTKKSKSKSKSKGDDV